MELTKNFKELNKNDVFIAGGKGASLGEMTQVGIPVPPGFVILSTTFDEFIKETDLVQEIDSILDEVNHKDINSVEVASEKIQALIKNAKMPENIAKEIKQQFKKLDTEYVAVRSSATAEDGAENAWAGQLDSYLNTKESQLLEKVQHCWASLFTPRAIFYRFEKGLHTTKISVAVVIQKMVNSEVSGIAFSVHPVTEDRNQMIIEAGFGLGEAIVSGSVTPNSYVIEKNPRKIIDINVSTQNRALYRVITGGNEWVDVPEPKASSQVLTEKQILEFANLIMRIENHYGFPCDIEWAFEKGKFYITQSRPITTLAPEKIKNKELEKFLTRFYYPITIQAYFNGATKCLEDVIGVGFSDIIIKFNGKKAEIFRIKEELRTKVKDSMLSYVETKNFSNGLKKYKELIHEYEEQIKKGSLQKTLECFEKIYPLLAVGFCVSNLWPNELRANNKKEILELCVEYRKLSDGAFNKLDKFIENYLKNKNLSFFSILKNNKTQPLDWLKNGYIFSKGEFYDVSWQDFLNKNNFSYQEDAVVSNENIIKGSTVFLGKVKGVVKIVFSPLDFNKIISGDILVSPMTQPSFAPILSSIAGIITDEGGITCHAAIVAREMKKPCIIGTKIATQILKDGDLVEVDANNGVVKILTAKNDQIVLDKMFSREKSLMYMMMWDISERIGYTDFIDYDINNSIFIYESSVNKTSVWYDKKESDYISELLFSKVKKDKKFVNQIITRLDKYWKEIFPYLSEKKNIESVKEFEKYYNGIIMWWSAMNTVYPLINNDDISKEASKIFLKYREDSEKFTGKMDTLIMNFWTKNLTNNTSLVPYLLIDEAIKLKNESLSNKELGTVAVRTKGYILHKNKVYPVSDMDRIFSEYNYSLNKIEAKSISEFKGVTAYRGKVTGTVRKIINKSDILNFKDGEVLVAETTFPDHVPAMKKAVAIVTDEGGVTCHAAIVSRELHTPCIIGTKIATQVLKDGDVVEVDADNGIIRIIKSSPNTVEKENWFNNASFKTELLAESFIHAGYRKSFPKLLPFLSQIKNRMIISNKIYIDLNEVNRLNDILSKNTLRVCSKAYSVIKKQSFKLKKVANEITKGNVSSVSSAELSKRVSKFFEEFQNTIGLIMLPALVDQIIELKVTDALRESSINDFYAALSKIAIPSEEVELMKERKELLKIAVGIKSEKIKIDSKIFKKMVHNHFVKYGWIHATLFAGSDYTEEEITKDINNIVLNSKKELNKIVLARKDDILSAKKVISKIKSKEGKAMAKFMQIAVYFRTARLEWMNQACFLAKPIISEAAKRMNVAIDDFIYFTPEEIINILSSGKPVDKSIFNQITTRRDGYALISDNVNERLLIVGKELKNWEDKFIPKVDSGQIKGITAFKGVVKGKAIILKDRSELHKAKEGDIIITPMTTPDFIVVMKKAAAIVTDLGGVTSHAAIVSRELGIPCIVGTKIATQIIKDGDLVEVDADNGVVKIINSNNK